MGFTHYWKQANDVDDAKWDAFCRDVRAIIDESNIAVVREYDNPEERPLISDTKIVFNGIGEDGHETFWVDRSEHGFGFCKTARKPYDEIVVACCIAGVESGVFNEWSSDGDDKDHADGKILLAASRA